MQIRDWIYRQVCESERPLHALMPDLVEAFVSSALGHQHQHKATAASSAPSGLPFAEEELQKQFSVENAGPAACLCAPAHPDHATASISEDHMERDLTPQLLLLYYMLYIYDQELSACRQRKLFSLLTISDVGHQKSPAISLFSDRLWDSIPITFLLQYAKFYLSDYRSLYPRLLQ